MKVGVFGLGLSGRGVIDLLEKEGKEVVVFDDSLEKMPSLTGLKYLVLSPGIPQTNPLVLEAKKRKIPICSDIQLALSRLDNKTIGITGTNGKTTATAYLKHCIPNSVAIGNIGVSACQAIQEIEQHVTVIVELSSFQLETCYLPLFDRALFLNLAPDHLDRYPSMQEYSAAKWNLIDCMRKNGNLYYQRDLVPPKEHPALIACDDPLATFMEEEGILAKDGFVKPPHRLEEIANIAGVRVYNDSKATNLAATKHALQTIRNPIVLIAGGRAKESTFKPLAEESSFVRCVIAIGEAGDKIAEDLRGEMQVVRVESLDAAVSLGLQKAVSGDALLLSPACASYDAYKNYEERGNHFKQLVRKYT